MAEEADVFGCRAGMQEWKKMTVTLLQKAERNNERINALIDCLQT